MRILDSADGTRLMSFDDGYAAVIIPSRRGNCCVCVSTQLGCPMGCVFCNSPGFRRNLTQDEIVGQVSEAAKLHDITSVVVMGMGEPMLNHAEVLPAIETIHQDFSIPYRRLTLSTCGMHLDRLIHVPFQVAISLHSPYDEQRRQMIGKVASINEILSFTQRYAEGRKYGVMIEYCLIKGLNDSDTHLQALLDIRWPANTNVNLIEFNPPAENPLELARSDRLQDFKSAIREHGLKCFIRVSRGADIGAACGLLSFDGQ